MRTLEPLLLRPAEVSRRLGLSKSMVYRMMRRRELPCVHIGRAVRVPTRDLNEWIAMHGAGAPGTFRPRVLPGGRAGA